MRTGAREARYRFTHLGAGVEALPAHHRTRLAGIGRGLRRPPDHDQHGWGELPAGRLVPAGSARRARSTKDLELLLAGRDAAGGRPGSGGCARSVPGRVTAMTATAREFYENARSEPYDASIITRD